MNQSTVRSATLELMRDLGMTTIFGNPGSTELPMYRDFPEDFSYVLGLQEAVVLGMADGYAQATGNASFVNLHSAAGLGHALGNLFTSFRNQTPIVVTAGQQARAILPFEPFLFAERATEFPRPYVKWSCEPARAEDVPRAIARAYQIAMQPPRGPVFVSIPVDDWDRPAEPVQCHRIGGGFAAGDEDVAEVSKALAEAKRPVLVLGTGVSRDGAWNEVVALAERHRMPVWVAPLTAQSVFPEKHPQFAGFLPGDRNAIVKALGDADLILALGGALSIYHVDGDGPHIPIGSSMILIANDPSVASWVPAGRAIVSDVRRAVTALLEGAEGGKRSEPKGRSAPAAPPEGRLTDAHLFTRIAALRPAKSVIVEEAPGSRPTMQAHLPILRSNGFYTCASGGLGYGLPAAVGMALGRPDEKIIAVLGDGSSMYAIQGLWSAAQLGLPISFVIIRNRRYHALYQFGRHFGLDRLVGTELPGLDFAAIAAGYGVDAEVVRDGKELDAALIKSFAAAGPTLVEVQVD